MFYVKPESPVKISAARRRGDAYEEVLLGRECLNMLDGPSIQSVRHEPKEFDPAGDVVVESRDQIDAFQAKHAVSPHALLDLEDLISDPAGIKLTALRLWKTWERYADSQKRFVIHIFTNRAAGPALVKVLQDDTFAPSFVAGNLLKTIYSRLRAAVLNPDDERFRRFLASIRFDLRQPGLDELRDEVRAEYIERRFGLAPAAASSFFERVRSWYESRHSTPITREMVLAALPIDRSTLPQNFPVDQKTLIDRTDAVTEVIQMIDRHPEGYSAVVGAPGSGKSTLLTRVAERLRRDGRPVVRYYGFIRLTDPDAARRVTRDEFVKSIIEQLYASYGDNITSGRRYDYSPQRLLQLLSAVGAYFAKRGQVLVLIVDGLDHVARARSVEESQKLYAVLPDALPPGVRCVLGTQSTVYVPAPIQLMCGTERTYIVPRFTDVQAQEYLGRYPTLRKRLSFEQVTAAARRGEGLPLYLRYVAERLLELEAADIDRAIAEIPSYTGDIDAYYAILWSDAKDASFVKLCGVLTRLQFPVLPHELSLLTGLDPFESRRAYEKVRHLLLVSPTGCRIFHNSFREFVVSHLSEEELHALDICVFEFLRGQKKGTREWFEYIVTFARLAGDKPFAVSVVDDRFVDGAIGAGVPASRVKRTIRDAVLAAANAFQPVDVARLASLSNNTHLQLSEHLNVPQLIQTLLALGEAEAAVVRVADAVDGSSISEVADVLIALANVQRRDVAKDVARTFLRNLPRDLRSVTDIMQVARVVAAYAPRPAEFLARTLYQLRSHAALGESTTSALVLLPELMRLLQRVNVPAIGEITEKLEALGDDGRDIWEEWRSEAAISEARRTVDPAAVETILLDVAKLDPARNVRYAGEAALLGCSTDAVRQLLGDRTFLPPVDNEAFERGGRALAAHVRAYAAALVGADRDEEFRTTDEYLADGGTWLSVYWRALCDTTRATVLLKRRTLTDTSAFLSPLDRLIAHRRPESERVYEVFPPIRQDVPTLLRDAIRGFMSGHGNPADLADHLARWGSSELVTFQFGLGIVVDDYSIELDALAIAAEFPHVHDHLKPLLTVVHDKISQNVLATHERSTQLLRVAEIAARIGLTARARLWRDDGVRAARGYGVRKDHTLDALIDAAKVVERVSHEQTPARLADLLDWCRWMGRLTDGKGTKWFFHYAFSLALEHDFALATNLLRTYSQVIGRWRYSACLADLLQRGDGGCPRLAYVLVECVDECTWEEGDGIRDRFLARAAVLRAASESGNADAAQWVRRRIRQSLIDEIPPETRAEYERDLAFAEAGATPSDVKTTASPSTVRLERTTEHSVEIDGATYSRDELRTAATASATVYARIHDALLATGGLYAVSDVLRDARYELMRGAGNVDALDTVVAHVEPRLSYESDVEYGEIAARYAALGARGKRHEMLRRGFAAIHGFGLHDKKLDYLTPLIEDDPDAALRFLLEHVAKQVDEHGYVFGAPTLLVRALEMFPQAYHDLIVPIYDAFHASVGSLFESLPVLPSDPFGWLRTSPTPIEGFADVAFELIIDEWKRPALHRKIALTHLLCDLALAEPKQTLGRLIFLLKHADPTLRAQAALVLDAVALRDLALLRPHFDEIAGSVEANHHVAIRHHLSRVLESLSDDAARKRASELVRSTITTIEIPSGTLRPSAGYERTLKRVLRRLRERVEYLAEVLTLDLEEMDWRIERQMAASGFEYAAVYEAVKEEWEEFSSRSERDIVPFEDAISRAYYHAAATVLDEITGGEHADPATRAVLAQVFRLYDPAFPYETAAAKPAELLLREAPAQIEDPDLWLAFDGISSEERVTAVDGPLTLFDVYSHGTREWNEHCFRISCIVEASSVTALADGTLNVDPSSYLEILATADDERTVTAEEAQRALRTSVPALRQSGMRSAVAFSDTTWWHALPGQLGSVSREVIRRYGLTFESPLTMHLADSGRRAVFSGRWADGVRARDGYYQSAGSGYRVALEPTLLKRMRDDGYAFLITESLTRRRYQRFSSQPPATSRFTRRILFG